MFRIPPPRLPCRDEPCQARAIRHPPCVAPSLLPGAGGPMGARQAGQRVLLGVLCWGCLAASPTPNPATERRASVSGNIPALTKQGRFGKSRVVWGSGWDRRRRPFPARVGGGCKGGALQNGGGSAKWGVCKAFCMYPAPFQAGTGHSRAQLCAVTQEWATLTFS